MITAIRDWLRSVIVVTLLISVSRTLTPEGNIRKIGYFTGGLILLTVLTGPWLAAGMDWEIPDYGNYEAEIARRLAELEVQGGQALAGQVAERAETWIENRALELGQEVRAEVDIKTRDGVPVPWSVLLVLLSGERDGRLENQIALELGIPESRQTWADR